VAEGWAGLECLAGIPGTVGATPIQNVGAYGQEIADTLRSVRVVDRLSGEVRSLPGRELAFGYRSSRLRRDPDRYLVLGVTFGLVAGGSATVRYGELARALGVAADGDPAALAAARPPLAAVRAAVLELRRGKSMVLDVPDDPNRRSVGSFFVNPVVGEAEARQVERRARATGLLAADEQLPSYPVAPGVGASISTPQVKLAAAWLIERSGFGKGFRRGAVGISSRHALALVHHGGGSTAELLALAADIQAAVRERFGVLLRPEPVPLGPAGFPDSVAPGLFTFAR
jgi:UDP-N-acetylmuramate dehydrogenase